MANFTKFWKTYHVEVSVIKCNRNNKIDTKFYRILLIWYIIEFKNIKFLSNQIIQQHFCWKRNYIFLTPIVWNILYRYCWTTVKSDWKPFLHTMWVQRWSYVAMTLRYFGFARFQASVDSFADFLIIYFQDGSISEEKEKEI